MTTNEQNKTIKFEVTPVAVEGITTGTPVPSSVSGTVLQTINISAIGGVTRPVNNAVPDTTVDETIQYTATISWSSPSGFRANGRYRSGAIYTATITITPKTGYTLQGIPANYFAITNATSVTNSENSGVVTATFPPT